MNQFMESSFVFNLTSHKSKLTIFFALHAFIVFPKNLSFHKNNPVFELIFCKCIELEYLNFNTNNTNSGPHHN